MKYTLLLLIPFLASASIAGPIFPGRCMIYAPEFRKPADTTKGAVFLRQQGIWGDITKGFGSTGDRYYWNISTGGIIQFVEWQHSAIYLLGDYEMVGDQHSNIHFHPRGIFWTEGILFADKIGNAELHTGYINRCHHDIDDLELQTVGNAEERTLIYSSLLANFVWRDVNISGIRSDLWTQFDWYVFKEDYLIPAPAQLFSTDMSRLEVSLSVGGKFDLWKLGDVMTYFRGSGITAAYNKFKTFTFDGRAELGVQFQGEGTAMNVYIGYETLQDDGTRPMPVNSHYPYIGFRFVGKNIGL